MRHKGYQLTRWADDWVVTCRTRAAANSALAEATKILGKLARLRRFDPPFRDFRWASH
jgi:hypothetical protein